MAVSENYLQFIQDQLNDFDSITYKKMFGGIGVFYNGKMFALINSKDVFHLKADESNRQQYEEQGMEPMGSKGNGKGGMPYFQVPVEILEDKTELKTWVQQSINIALSK